MKKLSLLTAFLLFGLTSTFAQGNVGIDVPAPAQKLDVDGAIKIGNTLTNSLGGGDIRYNSNTLQYHNGTSWISLNANTDNQTLSLVSNTLSISNGNSVNLAAYLDNTDDQNLTTPTLVGTVLTLDIEDGAGSAVTIDLDPLRRQLIDADLDTWIRVAQDNGSDNDIIRMTTSSTERMRVDQTGKVGIGTLAQTLTNQLHVEISQSSGLGLPVLLRNNATTPSGVGIGFNADNSGNYAKNTLYFERTADFGRGKFHVLMNNDNSATPATLADAKLTILSDGNVGIGVPAPSYKLHVDGKIKTTGINETSDARLKKDVQLIDNALAKVLDLRGVTYNWRTEEFPEVELGEGLQFGLIAQELEKVIPELVGTDDEGWKSIEYSHLVPVLIEAIKEQNRIIENHETVNAQLIRSIEILSAKVEGIEESLLIDAKVEK